MALSPWSWPLWWRLLILFNVSIYNMLGNVFAAGISPLFGLIMQEFHCTENEASQLGTYVLFTLGLSNFIALPLAFLIGKRYTIVVSLVVFLAANIWSGEAQSYQSLRSARILGGMAGGLIEALAPTIVTETFPERQLARAMVVYVGFLATGAALGPIISGAVAQGLGEWRWFQRIMSIAVAVNLVFSIIMLPETTHDDMNLSEGVALGEQGEEAETRKTQCKAEESMIENATSIAQTSSPVEQPTLKMEYVRRSFSLHFVELNWKASLISFFQPLELIVLPQVLVTVVIFGLTIGWTAITSILISIIYAQPPFLWGPLPIGLLNAGPLVGITLGLPIGGALADMLFNRATRRSNGVTNPATRLPALLPGALLSPAGCVVMGFALRDPGNYIVVSVGWGMLCLGLTSSANVLLTYAVGCPPTRAGHIGALANVTKNSIGFAVSYGAVDWLRRVGPVNQFSTMAGILWGSYLLVIPIWMFSKTLVRKTTAFA
ncbi:major facilitator superfamily domain-containing protein [Ilyonectria robusta]|uniref:major facilitator superfamily domain-containing protein n=1 Tax=Ilyonectria robusta TaxID=1079257 RepID=UPI001E8D7F52|nr:major facilitator superfamily domain-containing protein [Ilyonectria robusta]KAH8654331.1 major facilitator superfamily domain-containing protein [Ilyonectria robusta]